MAKEPSGKHIKKSLSFIYESLGLSPDTKLVIEDGHNVDMTPLEKTIPIPSIRTFTYVKYFKVKSKRWTQAFFCEH
jgi:hypothetical protein